MARLRSAPARQRRLAWPLGLQGPSARAAQAADEPIEGSSTAAEAPAVAPAVRAVAAVAAVLVVLDQLSKQWALAALDDGPIDLIGSLRLRLSFNSGTAFSVGSGRGGLISLFGLAVVAVLLRSVLRWPGRLPALAAGLVAGGAVGNLLDRFLRAGDGLLGGRVVDFIDLQWWPVFNVADIGICVGAGLLAILSFRAPEGPG